MKSLFIVFLILLIVSIAGKMLPSLEYNYLQVQNRKTFSPNNKIRIEPDHLVEDKDEEEEQQQDKQQQQQQQDKQQQQQQDKQQQQEEENEMGVHKINIEYPCHME